MDHYSVVIVNWNAGAALRRCLDAVFGSEGDDPQQVIIVDNASTDASLLGLPSVHPAVEIIQNVRNVGSARAVNQALRASRGQYAVVLNPDVVLQPSAMSQLMHFMASHPDAGLAGPRLFDADGRVQGSARRDPSAWTGLFGKAAPLTRLFPNGPISRRELPALSVVGNEAVQVD
jgi:GT2 family glycosyltransferase